MSIRLSLIIPVYNVSAFLPKCLESLRNQKYENMEVILVNDGSTDNSGNICDDFARENKKAIVIHKKNGGLSSARNAGFQRATGDYIWFIDSDDWIADYSTQKIMAYVDGQDIEMLHFEYVEYLQDKGELSSLNSKTEITSTLNGSNYLKNYPFVPMVWTYVYSREFLVENHLTFNESIIHEDVDFSLRSFAIVQNIKHIPDEFYFYRIRGNSLSQEITKHRVSSMLYLIELCQNLQKFEFEKLFIENRIYMYINGYLDLILKSNFKTREKIIYLKQLKSKKIILDINKELSFRKKARKRLFNLSPSMYFIYFFTLNTFLKIKSI